jgi:hypothetical protein
VLVFLPPYAYLIDIEKRSLKDFRQSLLLSF